MIDVEFRIGGRKVSFDKGWDKMEVQVLADVRKNIQQNLAQVRCPKHGGAPRRVVAEGPSLDKLEFFIQDSCCQKLIDEAAKALK